jgi:hypothetical protein
MALVETSRVPVRVVADRRIAGAMCGNELAWVRAGRFSDGRHREVALMLLDNALDRRDRIHLPHRQPQLPAACRLHR